MNHTSPFLLNLAAGSQLIGINAGEQAARVDCSTGLMSAVATPSTQYELAPTAPAFFDSPLSLALIAWFVMLAVTIGSIQKHEQRLGAGGTIAWIVVALIGGPFGAAAWFAVGRNPDTPPATQGPSPFS